MADLISPDPRLEMTELFIPGEKPIGEVVLRENGNYSSGIVFPSGFNQGNYYDDVGFLVGNAHFESGELVIDDATGGFNLNENSENRSGWTEFSVIVHFYIGSVPTGKLFSVWGSTVSNEQFNLAFAFDHH